MSFVEDNSAENEEVMDSDKDETGDDDFDSDSSSDHEDYDSSDYSCSEYEKRSDDLSTQLNMLEEHFDQLKEAFKKEKLSSLNSQLIQLVEEKSPDYLQPLEELKEIKSERIQIAGHIRDFRDKNARQNFEADLAITEQDYENEKRLLKDRIRHSIEEKIRKLNEDRHKADNDYMPDSTFSKRSRKYSGAYDEFSEKRRKPVTVNGPYIVYMLKEEEINEDISWIQNFSKPYKPFPLTYQY